MIIFSFSFQHRRCGPRLSAEAAEKLKNRYVMMRAGTREHEKDSEKRLSIPITIRQLEAIIRISEALAKMQMQPFATELHVNEALRLFQVSTLEAAMSGSLAGMLQIDKIKKKNITLTYSDLNKILLYFLFSFELYI